MSSRRPERILVVGLDGAGFDVVGPLMADGHMPTLARLQREGVSGPLTSMYPPVSAIAWPSFFTGVGPGKHGVFGFQTFDPEGYSQRLVSAESVRAPAMWEILGEHGKHTIAFDIPITYPPSPMRGAMVTGMLTPDDRAQWTYPAELKGELVRAVGRRLPSPTRRMLRLASPSGAVKMLRAFEEREVALFTHLLRTRPWDLAIIVFRTCDVIQHALLAEAAAGQQPPYELRGDAGRTIQAHYTCLDRLLGELLAAMPSGTATFVISDHGAVVVPRCFRVNGWMASEGYVAWSRWPRVRHATSLWRRRTFGRQLKALRVPFLSAIFPAHWLGREVATPRWSQLMRFCRGPDWQRTRAYACPVMREGIRINLKGRETNGIVEPGAEYEALRSEIIGKLAALTDPETGQRVVESARRREEMYDGELVHNAPDIVAVYPDGQYLPSSEPRMGSVFRSSRGLECAQHGMEGILVGSGPGLAAARPTEGTITDLVPTILYLLGTPVPEGLDGRILTDAIAPGLLDEVAPESAPAAHARRERHAETEAHPAVLRRLRDLGYID